MALRERGQLDAVHGGLSPELGGAQGEPVLVQHVKSPAAGGQHPPGTARGFGSQGLAEVAGGPREGRTATAAGRGRGSQMTIGVGMTAQGQGDPAGQQVRLGGVAGAERIQLGGRPVRLAEQPG